MIEKIKQILDSINKFFAFFLLLPLYFIGIGLSKLLYVIFVKKSSKEGWKTAEKLRRNIKYYEDML